jgi:hypothetical protein
MTMRRDYANLYALQQDDRRERTMSLTLAIGALTGAEMPAAAMAVLMAAERGFPNEQAEWNAIRAKFGLQEVAM